MPLFLYILSHLFSCFLFLYLVQKHRLFWRRFILRFILSPNILIFNIVSQRNLPLLLSLFFLFLQKISSLLQFQQPLVLTNLRQKSCFDRMSFRLFGRSVYASSIRIGCFCVVFWVFYKLEISLFELLFLFLLDLSLAFEPSITLAINNTTMGFFFFSKILKTLNIFFRRKSSMRLIMLGLYIRNIFYRSMRLLVILR